MSEKTKSNRPEVLRNRRAAGRQAQMSFPSKPLPHGIQLIFHKYDYSKFVQTVKLTSEGSIVRNDTGLVTTLTGAEEIATNSIELPFPRTLTDSQNIRVGSFEGGFTGEKIASTVAQSGATLGDTFDSIKDGVSNLLSSVREKGAALVNDPGALVQMASAAFPKISTGQAAVIGSYLARDISAATSASISAGGGIAVNPQDTLNFTGVDLKTFSFTWDLFPSNKNDSEQLKKIINFIKRQSLPETKGLADATGNSGIDRTFLAYPSIVEINLLGVNESHFMRFKRAMISNITVDYGSGGIISIMKGGVPSSVTLTISFQELNIHTADDYEEPPAADATTNSSDNAQNPGTNPS